MTSKCTSWQQQLRHDVKIRKKVRHDVQEHVMTLKSFHDVKNVDTKNFVMTSKIHPWRQKVRHEVKNTSWSQKVRYDVKTKMCHDVKNTSWRQKVCKAHLNVQKFVMTSKTYPFIHPSVHLSIYLSIPKMWNHIIDGGHRFYAKKLIYYHIQM